MIIDIYSTRNKSIYIAVQTANLIPEDVRKNMEVGRRPIKTIELHGKKCYVALDTQTTIADIEEKGYAVLGVSIFITTIN